MAVPRVIDSNAGRLSSSVTEFVLRGKSDPNDAFIKGPARGPEILYWFSGNGEKDDFSLFREIIE